MQYSEKGHPHMAKGSSTSETKFYRTTLRKFPPDLFSCPLNILKSSNFSIYIRSRLIWTKLPRRFAFLFEIFRIEEYVSCRHSSYTSHVHRCKIQTPTFDGTKLSRLGV